jgi:hypothetical protein
MDYSRVSALITSLVITNTIHPKHPQSRGCFFMIQKGAEHVRQHTKRTPVSADGRRNGAGEGDEMKEGENGVHD